MKIPSSCALLALYLVFQSTAFAQMALERSLSPQTLNLRDVIHRAELNNKDIRLAQQEIERQKARQRRALAPYLPKLQLGSTFTFNVPEVVLSLGSASAVSVATVPARELTAQLTLTQTLLDLKALSSIRDARLEGERLARALEEVKWTAYHEVALTYFQCVRTRNALRVSENNLHRSEALLKRARDKFRLGLARRSDSQRGEVEVESANSALLEAQIAHDHAIAALGVLIGESESFQVDTGVSLAAIEKRDSIDNLIEKAYTLRRDLLTQRAALRASKALHEGAYANFFPVIGATAQGFYTDNTAGLVPTPLRAAFVFSGTWTLYDGGDRYGQIRETRSQIRSDEIKIRDLEQHISAEVRGRALDIDAKVTNLRSLEKKLGLQKEIFSDVQDTYRQGLTDISELVTTSHELTSFELTQAEALVDLDLARLDFANVAGLLEEAMGL